MTHKTLSVEPARCSVEARKPRSLTRHFPTVARVFLGFFLFTSGTTGLLQFFPIIVGTQALVGALAQALVGALLLSNRFVPLALELLSPFIIDALGLHVFRGFHIFLLPSGRPTALILLALVLYLAWSYRPAFCPMLDARHSPAIKRGGC